MKKSSYKRLEQEKTRILYELFCGGSEDDHANNNGCIGAIDLRYYKEE